MIITDFVNNLFNELQDKGLTNNSANQYVKVLINIHKQIYDNELINSLNFLKDTQTVENHLEQKTNPNTLKTYYSIIVSILTLVNNKKFLTAIKFYRDKMFSYKTELEEKPKNTMNLIQKQNWIEWDDILQITNDYNKMADEISKKENITLKEYDILLYNLIISLYTLIPPRRNDYLYMMVVPNATDEDNNKNYLQLNSNKMIFNKYKTSSSYGRQIMDDLPLELINAIYNYLSHHPLYKNVRKNTKEWEIPLLVDAYGTHLNKINSITRILNKITGRKIGASMLRHIYITHKYGDNENQRKNDAENMAHSTDTQKQYILYDDDISLCSEDTDY
jgi:hypothetical protein